MYKIVHVKEGKQGISYWYFLNRVFSHFKVSYKKDTPKTVKQMFTLNTLIENECIEGLVRTMSQVSELIVAPEKLSMEVDKMRIALATKEAEITHLKIRNYQLYLEGPGASEELKAENEELREQVTTLTGEVKELNAEIKDLIK